MNQAIIFVRLFNKTQDYRQQLKDLRAIAHQQAVHVFAEIIDKARIGLPNKQREGIQQLLGICRQETIQKVLVSEISHLGSSKLEIAQLSVELTPLGTSIYMDNLGIETFKYDQPNPVIFNMFEKLVEKDRLKQEEICKRISNGIEKPQRQGKTIGRPVGSAEKQAAFLAKYPSVIQQLEQNLGVRETAKLCGVAINTVSKVKALL